MHGEDAKPQKRGCECHACALSVLVLVLVTLVLVLVLLVLLVLVLCHAGALLVSPLFVANPPCPLSWHHLVKSRIRYNPPFQPAL